MSSPFNKSFNSKSPLKEHRKIQRQINRARRKDGGDPDFYEKYAHLYEAKTKAEAAHNNERTEEGDSQVREDEDAAQGSAVEMQSPLHGYVDASDMVDSNPPTAHMWTNVIESFGDAYKNIVSPKNPCEGLSGDALQDCKNKQYAASQTDKVDTNNEVDTTENKKYTGDDPILDCQMNQGGTWDRNTQQCVVKE